MYQNLDLIRLAAVPLSLTLLSILSGSVINRVMVVELGLPVIVAGLFVAVPLLVAPARVWLGYLSDAYPIHGRRREPYLVLGAFLSGAGVLGLGLASGLTAASLLAHTVAFTSIQSAGLLLGVWGVGHLLGRALANLLGAGLVDLINLITGNQPLLAYGTAFLVEAALLLWALLAFQGLHIESSRTMTAS